MKRGEARTPQLGFFTGCLILAGKAWVANKNSVGKEKGISENKGDGNFSIYDSIS